MVAPVRAAPSRPSHGRVAAFFSGGVDSWSTVLDNPDVSDLIFVHGFDLLRAAHQGDLADKIEESLRAAAAELGLSMHVVETNLRVLTIADPLGGLLRLRRLAVALLFEPLFDGS